MNYVEHFDLLDIQAKQIPSITGKGAPTTSTEGAVGCLYMNTDNGDLYKCTAVNDGEYTWVETNNGSGSGDVNFQAKAVTPTLGDELVTAEGTWITDGWEGDHPTTGFKHIKNATTPLIYTFPEEVELTEENLYQVEFEVSNCASSGGPNASTAFSVRLGGSAPFITYNGGGPKRYSFGIRPVSNSGYSDFRIILTDPADPFKTEGTFDGTISNISIKKILDPYPALIETKDVDGDVNIEIRANDANNENFYMGKDAGKYNTTGEKNVGIGNHALEEATSAYWNVAIGAEAMRKTNVGSRCVGIGRFALLNNNGDRNYAIGTFALRDNTSGRMNVAIGADTLWANTTGCRNISIGSASQCAVTTSNDNVSIGHCAMADKKSGDMNVAVGNYAMQQADGVCVYNVAVGYKAQYRGGGKQHNVSIGYTAGANMTRTYKLDENGEILYVNGNAQYEEAMSNVGVGSQALELLTTGKYNVAVGHGAGREGTTCLGNTFIGFNAGMNASGSSNVFVGRETGKSVTGNNNVLVGTYAGFNITGKKNPITKIMEGNNICIGYYSGKIIKSGIKNICIGDEADIYDENADYMLNIGNSILGDMANKLIAVNKTNDGTFKAHFEIGASNGTYPPLALTAGTLTQTPVEGAIEYDGDAFYLTGSNKTRDRLVTANNVLQAIEDKSVLVNIRKIVEGNTLILNDVLKDGQDIECSISGVESLEGVTVTSVGKNLCPNKWKPGTIYKGAYQNSSSYVCMEEYIPIDTQRGYYISGYSENIDMALNNSKGPQVIWHFYNKDKVYLGDLEDRTDATLPYTYSYFNKFIAKAGTTGAEVKIPEDAAFCRIAFQYQTTEATTEINLQVQLEIGNAASENYEEYKGQTYTTDDNGVVEGMTTISPYMHVFSNTEGAKIKLSYDTQARVYCH